MGAETLFIRREREVGAWGATLCILLGILAFGVANYRESIIRSWWRIVFICTL